MLLRQPVAVSLITEQASPVETELLSSVDSLLEDTTYRFSEPVNVKYALRRVVVVPIDVHRPARE